MRAVLLAAALAAGAGSSVAADAEHGASLFDLDCSACHSVAPTLKNKMGPSLYGVVGRKAGAVEGYAYSPSITASGLAWSPETLDAYLTDPKKLAPETKMKFEGLPKPEDRADIIAFLSGQK